MVFFFGLWYVKSVFIKRLMRDEVSKSLFKDALYC